MPKRMSASSSTRRLGVDPVADRDVAVAQRAVLVVGPAGQEGGHPAAAAAADELLDLARDELGLLVLVVGVEQGDLRAGAAIGPELLVLAALVAADDGMGRVEDRLGRSVVLLELDDLGIGIVGLEVEDVAQVRAAPRVDALVVVADDRRGSCASRRAAGR